LQVIETTNTDGSSLNLAITGHDFRDVHYVRDDDGELGPADGTSNGTVYDLAIHILLLHTSNVRFPEILVAAFEPLSDAEAIKTPAANISVPLQKGTDVESLLSAFYGNDDDDEDINDDEDTSTLTNTTNSTGVRRLLWGRRNRCGLWCQINRVKRQLSQARNYANHMARYARNQAQNARNQVANARRSAANARNAWRTVSRWKSYAKNAIRKKSNALYRATRDAKRFAIHAARNAKRYAQKVNKAIADNLDKVSDAVDGIEKLPQELIDKVLEKIEPLKQLSGCDIINSMQTEINNFLDKQTMCLSPSCSGNHLNSGRIETVHDEVGFKVGVACGQPPWPVPL
jgi:hypothetical protein